MILGITGRAGAGKSTVATILEREHKAVIVSLADEMKRICRSVYGFTDEQLWGPSEMRNKADLRYPRAHSWGMGGASDRCPCCGLKWDFNDDTPCYLTPRFALQLLGTEWGRTCFQDTWVRKTMAIARDLLDENLEQTFAEFKDGEIVGTTREHARAVYDAHVGVRYMRPEVCTRLQAKIVCVPDIRYDNEAKAIRAAGGKIIAKASAKVVTSTHSSEAGISEALIDAWIPHVIADDHQKLTDALAKHVRAIVEGT